MSSPRVETNTSAPLERSTRRVLGGEEEGVDADDGGDRAGPEREPRRVGQQEVRRAGRRHREHPGGDLDGDDLVEVGREGRGLQAGAAPDLDAGPPGLHAAAHRRVGERCPVLLRVALVPGRRSLVEELDDEAPRLVGPAGGVVSSARA